MTSKERDAKTWWALGIYGVNALPSQALPNQVDTHEAYNNIGKLIDEAEEWKGKYQKEHWDLLAQLEGPPCWWCGRCVLVGKCCEYQTKKPREVVDALKAQLAEWIHRAENEHNETLDLHKMLAEANAKVAAARAALAKARGES